MPPIHNHVVNHIAISVPDRDKAVEWYESVFGFKKIRPSKTSDRASVPDSPIFKIYGAKLHKVHIAYLTAGNGVGFEIFQFVDPPTILPSDKSFNFQSQGVFHIAVTVPDTDEAVKKVIEAGGDQVGETIDVGKEVDGGPIKAAYVRDPWGTVIEVLNVDFNHLMAMQMMAQ